MEILFDRVWQLTPDQARTNLIVPFSVPHAFDHLEFHASYGPKVVTDPEVCMHGLEECMEKYVRPQDRPDVLRLEDFDPPVNFVTISIDCGDEYVGCAHRHPNDQTIVIGENDATLGFFRHKIEAGDWRVVLNVHAVVAGTVEYHLTITGKEAGEA
ncbi:MAG: hypothetical protein ACI4PD_02045 [Butyricicoccus sp.]